MGGAIMDNITKLDKDTFEIKTETVETVSLSQLEAELENLEKLEQEANDFNAWVDTLPAEKQTFIQKQYIVVPQELRDKVEQLKKVK
jgi:hypothetical protein